jgi:two-component system response regulator NreC
LPDVVLMDVDMPHGGGIAATRELRHEFPGLRVIALSMHDDTGLVQAMTDAGACAYVRKGEPLPVLLAAIEARPTP